MAAMDSAATPNGALNSFALDRMRAKTGKAVKLQREKSVTQSVFQIM
jgi:hypothetical protein